METGRRHGSTLRRSFGSGLGPGTGTNWVGRLGTRLFYMKILFNVSESIRKHRWVLSDSVTMSTLNVGPLT